jgi:mono/diheme cytochrome c family protein
MKLFRWIVALALLGAVAAWVLSAPRPLPDDMLAGLTPDPANGELVFHAGGCASCHAAEKAEGAEKLVLKGGRAFASPFGTFYAPNISADAQTGIGGWSAMDLANAMLRGVSPDGAHYYPAFPYTSYIRATAQDVVDLHAYMATLSADATPSRAHDVGFPFNIRRSLGLWKWLYLREDWVVSAELSAVEQRGRYLSEALGHCGECHTPRGPLGGLSDGQWLAGAPNPSGSGRIPNITPGALDWSERDIAAYLETGFTPEYDSAGGHMVAVIENFAQLPAEDRAAVAAYLKRVAPIE